jgi:hypothetical protein
MKITPLSICKDDKGRFLRAPGPHEVSEERGKALISAGAAEPAGKKKESGGKDAASGSGGELAQAQRDAKIREALDEMLAEDPLQENNLLWTKAGDPRNKTVDQRTGLDVTNEELEPIWAELKPKD